MREMVYCELLTVNISFALGPYGYVIEMSSKDVRTVNCQQYMTRRLERIERCSGNWNYRDLGLVGNS